MHYLQKGELIPSQVQSFFRLDCLIINDNLNVWFTLQLRFDVWCEITPFSKSELYSWYMVSDVIDNDSSVRVNRKRELVEVKRFEPGNEMIEIAYLTEPGAAVVKKSLKQMNGDIKYVDSLGQLR